MVEVYSKDEIDEIIQQLTGPASGSGEHWYSAQSGFFGVVNLLHLNNVADQSGIIDVDIQYPGLVPDDAKSLILTVERGWSAFPPGGTGCVSLRIMPYGYNLSNVLDYAKNQAWVINGMGVDVIADQVRIPIKVGAKKLFWAIQSSHPASLTKMAIIDLCGYAV